MSETSSPTSSSRQEEKDYFDVLSPPIASPTANPFQATTQWSQRRNLAGRYNPRRDSNASTSSSIAGSLDIPLGGSRIGAGREKELGQNAISTLLQAPIVRTGLLPHTSATPYSHRPPSTRDIPPVTLTNVPHVDPAVFRPYLSQVGRLYEARARLEEDPDQGPKRERLGSGQDDFATSLDQRLRSEMQRPRQFSRTGSVTALSPLESPSASRRQSATGRGARRRFEVTPLTTIPSVYFEDNFHLENPRTFDIVSERSEVVRSPTSPTSQGPSEKGFANGSAQPPRKALATNAILQEKLSWYLDTVEIHLISSISQASKSFFAALGSLKELHAEASNSVSEIKKLREDLGKLDKSMAIGGLEIVNMKQRQENLRKLYDSVEQLHNVMQGAAHCEKLVGEGSFEPALDHIGILEEYTCGKSQANSKIEISWLKAGASQPPRDLRRLRALDGFAEGMDQLRARVGKGYESQFVGALISDLREHVSKVPNQETVKRWAAASLRSRGYSSGPSAVPAYVHTEGQFRQNLSVVLHGLSRSKSLTIATAAFRDAVMREMKALIRQHLPSSNDDDAESVASVSTVQSRANSRRDKSAILARNLKALGPEDAEDLFMKIYCGVGEALRRLQIQVKMLLDVTSGQSLSPTKAGPGSPPKSPAMDSLDASVTRTRPRADSTLLQEQLMQALDLSSLLGQAVDATQTQITKILKVRSDQSASLPSKYFLRYFNLNRLFADECEAVSSRSGASLKSVVNNNISDFIAEFAQEQQEQLERTMDRDQWSAKDFTDADNFTLSLILQSMSSDPQQWVAESHVWEDIAAPQTNGSTGSRPNGTVEAQPTSGKEQARPALVDEEKFMLVSSAIALLHGIARFQTLVACIPSIATDVSKALIEYLRFFSSRANQLVLGAGATRSSAALANINTKHLALSSQAFSFAIALVPYIREFMRRKPGMAIEKLTEFDKVKRVFQDYQVSINDKYAEILGTRSAKHIKTHNNVDFDLEGTKEDAAETVSAHMQTLAKETVVLHRTLGRYLNEGHVKMAMAPIFVNYREQWGAALRGSRVTTEAGKARLLNDAEHFNAKLGQLDGAGDTGLYLKKIVTDKIVAAPPKPSKAATVAEKAPPRAEKESTATKNASATSATLPLPREQEDGKVESNESATGDVMFDAEAAEAAEAKDSTKSVGEEAKPGQVASNDT